MVSLRSNIGYFMGKSNLDRKGAKGIKDEERGGGNKQKEGVEIEKDRCNGRLIWEERNIQRKRTPEPARVKRFKSFQSSPYSTSSTISFTLTLARSGQTVSIAIRWRHAPSYMLFTQFMVIKLSLRRILKL